MRVRPDDPHPGGFGEAPRRGGWRSIRAPRLLGRIGPWIRPPMAWSMARPTAGGSATRTTLVPLPHTRSTRWPCSSPRSAMSAPVASKIRSATLCIKKTNRRSEPDPGRGSWLPRATWPSVPCACSDAPMLPKQPDGPAVHGPALHHPRPHMMILKPELGQLSAHLSAVGFRLAEHGFRAFSGCLFPCRSRGNLVRAKTSSPTWTTGEAPVPVLVSPASYRAWRRSHATGCPARPGGNVLPVLR